jgi:hypothetical protein
MQATSGPDTVDVDARSIANSDIDMPIKNEQSHIENSLKPGESAGIVHISDEENKRLRRKIHMRCALPLGDATFDS